MLKKNTKKFKRSRKQYLKQKGGAAPPVSKKFNVNTEELFTKALAYCSPERSNYTCIIELLNEIFGEKKQNFALDVSLKDPFLQSPITDPDYYNRWYREKVGISLDSTEEFKLMSDPALADLKILEFKTLIAQIARDCLIMLSTSRRNIDNQYRLGNNKISEIKQKLTNSKTEIEKEIEIIKEIEIEKEKEIKNLSSFTLPPKSTLSMLYTMLRRIKENLQMNKQRLADINNELSRLKEYNNSNKKVEKLSKPIDKIREEIEILLGDINTCIENGYIYSHILRIIIKFLLLLSENYNKAEEDEIFNEWISKPHIFFPSYRSINFQTVVALISAPIINFRLSNRARSVHGLYDTPMYDASHDIAFHARKTHKFSRLLGKQISYINYFTTMNKLLTLLFPYYYCNEKTEKEYANKKKLTTYTDLTETNKKNVMSLLLFTILHEMLDLDYSFKKYLFNFTKPIKNTIVSNLEKEVSNNMFDMKYPFVRKLDWKSVVDAFVKLIADLNKDGNKYDNLVAQLPD